MENLGETKLSRGPGDQFSSGQMNKHDVILHHTGIRWEGRVVVSPAAIVGDWLISGLESVSRSCLFAGVFRTCLVNVFADSEGAYVEVGTLTRC